MTISTITAASAAASARPINKTLDTACHEFESLLLSNILKQGIISKPDEDEEDNGSANNALLTEFGAEQTAHVMSQSDITGIAALMKRQMTRTPGD